MLSNLHKSKYKIETILVGITIFLGTIMAAWVSHLGLTKTLTDQNAHLNAAKLVMDSMTPGVSQMGFWPPLLHILLLPFVWINGLYESGLAGSIVLIPVLAVAALFLYRLTLAYTNDKFLSFVAALLLIINPYILYYAVTPMMEVLFVANLLGVAYFLARYLAEDKLWQLIAVGVFITLTTLSRFEGLILIPVCGAIVLVHMLKARKQYSEIEAALILFSVAASLGLAAVVVYSWVFSHNPLTFTGGSWLRDPAEAVFLTRHNLGATFEYLLHASFYMLSKPLVYISVASFVFFWLLSSRKFSSIAILLVLFSPFVFIAASLYTGAGTMAVADLPPYNFFSNERYSLTWIGFVILTPVLLVSAINYYLSRYNNVILRYSGKIIRNVLALALVGFSLFQLYEVSYASRFAVIRKNINSPLPEQVAVRDYLLKNYDYGKILLTKADNDPVLAQSDVDLRDYIYEGNYIYFDQTNDEPWLFARYVIMHNPDDGDPWAHSNETVMNKWGNNDQFNHYYDLVLSNKTRRIYKIKEASVRELARSHNLDEKAIPSINRGLSWWDPTDIYARIQNQTSVGLK